MTTGKKRSQRGRQFRIGVEAQHRVGFRQGLCQLFAVAFGQAADCDNLSG